MTDEWEGLFRIWHQRAHDKREILGTIEGLAELERRIVKLEAIMLANEKQRAMEARLGTSRLP